MFAFDLERCMLVVDPAPAVTDDLVPGFNHRLGRFGIAHQAHRDGEDADPKVAFGKEAQEPPHATAASVLEGRLGQDTASAAHRRQAEIG